jgi:hypothetical protein
MRLAGKQKLGYLPLPLAESERIRSFLKFPVSGCAALDPKLVETGLDLLEFPAILFHETGYIPCTLCGKPAGVRGA